MPKGAPCEMCARSRRLSRLETASAAQSSSGTSDIAADFVRKCFSSAESCGFAHREVRGIDLSASGRWLLLSRFERSPAVKTRLSTAVGALVALVALLVGMSTGFASTGAEKSEPSPGDRSGRVAQDSKVALSAVEAHQQLVVRAVATAYRTPPAVNVEQFVAREFSRVGSTAVIDVVFRDGVGTLEVRDPKNGCTTFVDYSVLSSYNLGEQVRSRCDGERVASGDLARRAQTAAFAAVAATAASPVRAYAEIVKDRLVLEAVANGYALLEVLAATEHMEKITKDIYPSTGQLMGVDLEDSIATLGFKLRGPRTCVVAISWDLSYPDDAGSVSDPVCKTVKKRR